METVQKGDEMYHGVVLDVLKTIFEVRVFQKESRTFILQKLKIRKCQL